MTTVVGGQSFFSFLKHLQATKSNKTDSKIVSKWRDILGLSSSLSQNRTAMSLQQCLTKIYESNKFLDLNFFKLCQESKYSTLLWRFCPVSKCLSIAQVYTLLLSFWTVVRSIPDRNHAGSHIATPKCFLKRDRRRNWWKQKKRYDGYVMALPRRRPSTFQLLPFVTVHWKFF